MPGRSTAVLERLVERGREKYLAMGGVLLFALAYRNLLTLGTRYGFESGVESWLMSPNDRAPILAIAISTWLAYRRWDRVAALPPRRGPAWLIGACFVLGAAVYLWGVHTLTDELLALSLFLNVTGLVALRWGRPGLRALWLPIAFLLFAIPIPTPLVVEILWALRLWTAEYAGWLLWILGLPALVSGDQILRAEQTFQVIEGCSGLRSAETLTMLVVLLVDLFHRRGWHAALLLLAAPPVAFALNGLRVLTLILNPHSEIATVHSLQGIAILLAGLLVVYAFDGLLERVLPAPRTRPAPESAPPDPGRARATRAHALAVLWGLGALSLVASFATPRWQRVPIPLLPIEATLDAALADYDWEPIDSELYFLGRIQFRTPVHRRYQVGTGRVEVFVADGTLRDRRTTPFGPLNAVPGTGWTVRSEGERDLPFDGRHVRELIVEKGLDRRVAIQWYEGAKSLAGESWRALLGMERSPFARPPPFLVVRISAGIGSFEAEAIERSFESRIRPIYERLAPALDALVASPERATDATADGGSS